MHFDAPNGDAGMTELDALFGPHMLPLTPAARRLMVRFSRWVVAQLHEMGANTAGLGRVDPRWRLYSFAYGRDMLQRELDVDRLTKMIARTWFYGKPRTPADCSLCFLLASLAAAAGLIAAPGVETKP
jgi:hypothetical protein